MIDSITISNLLYETEYIILSVPDYSREFLDFDLTTREETEDEEVYEERKSMADRASVVEGILAATQIFVYAALREIPPKAKSLSILLVRLRVAVDRPGVSMLGVWQTEKNVNILLWVLVIASSVASNWGCRTWWIARLSEVVKEIDIHSELELEGALQRVAWTDVFFGEMLSSIWDELRGYRRAMEMKELHAEREQEEEWEETVDPRLLDRGAELEDVLGCPVTYDKGRWRVNGWYV
jgi:hypothetical protein